MSVDSTYTNGPDKGALRDELLRRRLAGKDGGRRSAIGLVDRDGPLPLSFGQQQMWFLGQLDPDSAEYLVPVVLRLRGTLDAGALADAWEGVLARHEILRTRYEFIGGADVRQVIDPPRRAGLPVTELADLDGEEREQRLRSLVDEEIGRPIDLGRAWPVRGRLFRLADDDHLLAVTFHHIACDAWSVGIFAQELGSRYRSALAGSAPDLPELAVQYADFAAWQRREMSGAALDKQLGHWRDRLADVRPLELPTDRPRPAVRSWAGDSVGFTLPAELADRARELAQQHDTTLFTVLLAAFQGLLSRHADSTDVPVGVVVSGRGRPELQRLIGYGINTLVVRARWDSDCTFAGLLTHVRDTVLEAFDHQAVPFARVVDELEPERDLSRTPLFQMAFVLHENRGAAFTLPGVETESLTDDRVARFDLTLNVEQATSGALDARFSYATSLYDRATVERMAARFTRLLDQVTAAPDILVTGVDLLPAAERARLAGWSGVLRTADEARAVLDVFAGTPPRRLTVRVLDGHGDYAPIGVAGDVYLDPVTPVEGLRARYLADGTLDILDGAAEPAGTGDERAPVAAHTAPATPLEERIAGEWAAVLGRDTVGVQENFFDIGGDSMRAVRLAGALREAGFDVSIHEIFAAGTVARLAEVLAGQETGAGELNTVGAWELVGAGDRALLPEGVVDAYPLTQVQTGMIVEMLNHVERNAYHSVTSFRIPDERALSLPTLRAALDVVVGRHEVLRTSVELTEFSQPLQLVHGVVRVPLVLHDLRGLDADEQRRAGLEFIADERGRPFVLSEAPLMRVAVHLESDRAWRITFTQCHAITDGWSLNSLLMELLDAYRSLRDGLPLPPYEAPAVRYADVVAAELEALDSAEHREFWERATADRAPFTLPAAWGRPDTEGEPYRLRVPFHHLEERLRRLAAGCGASFKSVLLAAHLKVLSGLTPERSFHTGLITHGRLEASGGDRVLGMHLNSVPFPADRSARTWRELVTRTFRQETEVWGHRLYPLPAIQRLSDSGDRLLSVVFEYLDFHQVDSDTVDREGSGGGAANEFDLTVVASAGYVNLSSRTDLIGHEDGERLADMYRQVLTAMAEGPDGDATVAFLPKAERRRLLQDLGVTPGTAPELPVHRLIEQQAAETPLAVAVSHCDGALTYAELDERANRVAHRLRALGAGPDTLVGVRLDRGPDLVPTLLGVWKSGAGYLPLDPSVHGARLRYMLEDTGAPLVVTSTRYADELAAVHDGTLFVLDREEDRAAVAAQPHTRPEPLGDRDNLAYVMYTSGSTGNPKGVVVPHIGVANYLLWASRAYGSHGTGGAPVFSSISFDLGLPDLFAPLLLGQTVHLLPQDLPSEELGRELAQAGPFSFIKLTPGHLDLLAHQLSREQAASLAGLVIGAGDSFSSRLAHRWRELAGPDGTPLAAEYGPTETSVGNSGIPLTEIPDLDLMPLGAPVPNSSMYVLDEWMEPVPVGIPGEVYIGGIILARGYLGKPGMSAERFVPDPYGEPGSRLYRTGDLAQFRADGCLEFLGRMDHQVKIRGYRVELGEIQYVLGEHNDVQEAIVVLHRNEGDAALAAYVVGAVAAAVDTGVLRAHLAERLPEYMVPASFTVLDHIPLTSNGKLDRKALPAPDRSAFARTEHVAPRTPIEKQLTQVWSDILGVGDIGVHDRFFDIGGDSMRAVRMAGVLRESGYDIGIGDIFAAGTVAELAGRLVGQDTGQGLTRAVGAWELVGAGDRALLPEGVVDAYPLTQVQTGMIVEMLNHVERNAYHSVTSFRIPDERALSLPTLRAALDVVVGRHEVLRTSVELTEFSQPLQLVHGVVRVPLVLHDLRGLDADEQRRAGLEFIADERGRPFVLSEAPLMRVAVHLESDRAWRITFTQCHAITDGWSYHTLLMELLDAYRSLRDGLPLPPYEAPAVRYADVVAAELEALEDTGHQAYWQGVVREHVPFALPDSWAQPGTDEVFHLRVPFHDLEEPLRKLAAETGTSLKTVILAAHLKVLSGLTPERSFHTGLITHGRLEASGGDRVLGMHLNSVPFPADRSARTWRELVTRTFRQETEVWGHRLYPLPAIQRLSDSGDRLVSVTFNFLDFHQVDSDVVDLDGGFGVGGNEFELSVFAIRGHLVLGCRSSNIGRVHAERMAAMYRQVFTAIAENPDADAITAVMPEPECTRLRNTWNDTAVEWPGGTVLDVIEEAAARTPDAPAVISGECTLTFRELDEQANRVAHRLRALGAGPDTLVGVHLERGPGLVPALLGVWKAGAAYLPLDPANPADRLSHMLADSGVRVLVSESRSAAPGAPAPEHGVVRLDLDLDRETIAAESPARPSRTSDPDQLAYVIYTSGSTGTPKGVMVTQRGLANHLRWAARDLTAGGGGAPLFSSIAFDLPATNLYVPLMTGRPVTVLPAGTAPGEIGRELAKSAPYDFIKLTPGHLDLLTHQLGAEEIAGLARRILVAGEALQPRTANHYVAALGPGRLINEYGPTETSIGATAYPVDDEQTTVVPLGRALPNTTTYVLNEWLEPVPLGVPGEVFIGGIGLARGYLARPGLTAERFVPDSCGTPGARLYRTGDLGRFREDGALEFLGRIDDQVKIRGYRVELGEIQHVLAEHPAVRECVVLLHRTADGEAHLAGYAVPADGTQGVDPVALRDHLAGRLPEYMIPTTYTAIEQIPLTSNGKLDRRALPDPDRGAGRAARRTAPRTPTEQRLAAVWASTLGLDEVGVEDNFFDLGGHSILAVRMLAEAREAGVSLAVWMIYQAGSLGEMALLADENEALGTTAPRAAAEDDTLPLLPAQRRTGNEAPPIRTLRLTLARRLDASLLAEALAATVARHEGLRLRLDPEGNRRDATVAEDETAVLLRTVPLADVAAEDRSAVVAAEVAAAECRLDPVTGPVLQAVLLDVGADRLLDTEVLAELWIVVHGTAADEESLAVITDDLNTAYGQLAGGRKAELPPVKTTLCQWAHRLAHEAASPNILDQGPFWLNRRPGTLLPRDHVGAAPGAASTVTTVLAAAPTATLLAGEDPQATVLTALGRVLGRWAGGDALDVALRTNPRGYDAQLARTVGPLSDTVPIGLWLPRSRELPQLVRSVARQLAALPAPLHGYGLLRDGGVDPDLAAELRAQPHPEVRFALVRGSEARVADVPLAYPAGGSPSVEGYLLDVEAVISGGQCYLRWTHREGVHEPATVRRLADEHVTELARLTDAAPAARKKPTVPGVADVMARHGIPGASIAVIRGGEVVSVEHHGVLDAGDGRPVTADSLFAAASITKHLTTFTVLRLLAEKGIGLDEDVNRYLVNWRVPGLDGPEAPEGPQGGEPVTFRHLVANLAGFAEPSPTRRGGYDTDEPWPTVLDLLHGRPPADGGPVRREFAPGARFRLNNFHYLVLQQAMEDITGAPYHDVVRQLLFGPLGMDDSGITPDHPDTSGRPVAHGHDMTGTPLPGGRRVYPESAARGLWVTAGDLAKLVIAVRDSAIGRENGLVPQELVREMLTPHSDRPYGWGTIIDNTGIDLEFGHGGQAAGYQAMFGIRANSGDGTVILTNSVHGRALVTHLMANGWTDSGQLAGFWQRAMGEAAAREREQEGPCRS
ncbi:amino acid adenylation domain-containing protein (plasmid) [Streptomyces sp. NBC_00963]|uniref:amino acid adenylation domain-containing protein n=1 Tax=Streptomyces sp. NBC_00963 TaxID=2903697 RepID=UPI002F908650|nr:amino acid adenylation domain-containing protein [Streptomyces sp. NBC_00963]